MGVYLPDGSSGSIPKGIIWGGAGVYLAVIIAFYALRSIAIFVMAKRRNIKNAWLAFLPCIWFYTACKLVGDSKFFSKTVGGLAWLFTTIFIVSELLAFAYSFIVYLPIVGNFIAGNELHFVILEEGTTVASELKEIWGGFPIYGGTTYVDPYLVAGISDKALNITLTIISIASDIFALVSMIITIYLYICIFRKYWPQHFILAVALSWIGIFEILLFIIRKKDPVDYNEYLRSRYNGWYANGNPYGNNYNQTNNTTKRPNDPFEEFAGKGEKDPGDPFDEFDKK